MEGFLAPGLASAFSAAGKLLLSSVSLESTPPECPEFYSTLSNLRLNSFGLGMLQLFTALFLFQFIFESGWD